MGRSEHQSSCSASSSVRWARPARSRSSPRGREFAPSWSSTAVLQIQLGTLRAARDRADGDEGHQRPRAAGGGARYDRGPHRRRAALRGGAGAGDDRGLCAGGEGGALRAGEAAFGGGDPGHAARSAGGAARSAGQGEGDGAGGRRRSGGSSRFEAAARGEPAQGRGNEAQENMDRLVAAELVHRKGGGLGRGRVSCSSTRWCRVRLRVDAQAVAAACA